MNCVVLMAAAPTVIGEVAFITSPNEANIVKTPCGKAYGNEKLTPAISVGHVYIPHSKTIPSASCSMHPFALQSLAAAARHTPDWQGD